ncbi:uncharacterized protein LOC143559171 [Bidens hawaiensis]|uniref:uncharacterized protein LOC143559171 n=1 Tax=Bidens hawaiensis TaxID=980011 RepID=UPI00404BA1A8
MDSFDPSKQRETGSGWSTESQNWIECKLVLFETGFLTRKIAASNGANVMVSQAVANAIANHAEKPKKFSGSHFKMWQQKMLFYLTTLNLARFLTESPPQVTEGGTNTQGLSAVNMWKHSEFLCRNFVLNGLVDELYGVFCSIKTAKELWESLDCKYNIEHTGTMKIVVARFLDYKMVDSKTLISQIQELQVILQDIHAEWMTLCETFQVAAMIEKLPPSWADFKNYLKYKLKEMTMNELVVRLRTEEDNRIAQKGALLPAAAKAHVVEYGQTSRDNKSKGNDKVKVNFLHLVMKRDMKKKPPPFQDNRNKCKKVPKREPSRR